jgi:tRNA 2-selenouridine synthase
MGVGFQIQKTGDFSAHNAWIRVLLEEYYDPMYEYQLSKKQSRIVGSGTQEGLLEYADYSPKKP